jgi:hypothetical protein
MRCIRFSSEIVSTLPTVEVFCENDEFSEQMAHATMTHGSVIAQFMQHNWQFYRFELAIPCVLCTPSAIIFFRFNNP